MSPLFRELTVPPDAAGMRLDRFLAAWFRARSRTELSRAVRAGEVTDTADNALRGSSRVAAGQVIRITTPGIAPTGPPPPLPPVLHVDDRLIALDKPPDMLTHPVGTEFAWAVIQLARDHWPGERIDLVHRLDRDTSGVLLLTRDLDANRILKAAVKTGEVHKEYEALCRGAIPWDTRTLDGAIGPAGGEIRIQMAVTGDGLPARTDVTVLARSATMTHVRCVLHTGRTHQIRVHLADAGHGVVGDRLYGVPPEVFLHAFHHGVDDEVLAAAGAPRHALHARRIHLQHPDGHPLQIESPLADDLQRWWADPDKLPFDRQYRES